MPHGVPDMAVPERHTGDMVAPPSITGFGPDFPFSFDHWVSHEAGLGTLPKDALGAEVAVIGAGMAGIVAGLELMKLGLRPIYYEPSRIGGRLRTEPFTDRAAAEGGPVADLGGMRFPTSGTTFHHYVDLLGLETTDFPNPLTKAAGSTVVDLFGESTYLEHGDPLPQPFQEVADAWSGALEAGASFTELQAAIGQRDAKAVQDFWHPLIHRWDDRTFYDFIATTEPFASLPFRQREVFGQVGFGTGGWDSDFRNSMLEILRVVLLRFDEDQRGIVGGAAQVPRRLWSRPMTGMAHWPDGTSLSSLNGGGPRPGARAISRTADGSFEITDRWGATRTFPAVLATCQSWLLTTAINVDEDLLPQDVWMALDRTSYMQSSKTFVMVDRPFWRDRDSEGREVMSMTLTDRNTRGTYLLESGPGEPAVILLSYAWMADALKVLPLSKNRRVELALDTLRKIYPDVDIASHIIGEPITVSWEADPNFQGAFKGALPGHYRYNRRMYGHFMQDGLDAQQRGLFLAGDDVSWTPGWAEGAVQTALNAVWGITHFFGGRTSADNPGPGDLWPDLAPLDLDG